MSAPDRIERWGRYELSLEGPQDGNPFLDVQLRAQFKIEPNWGNISAHEMAHRLWLGTVGGGYVGHGETYLHPQDILWWSKGGVLHGQSPPRIAFLKEILEQGPPEGLDSIFDTWRWKAAGKEREYYLFYFGVHQPAEHTFDLPAGSRYQVDVIDTWEMTITPQEGTFEGKFKIALPGKPYCAVRIKRNPARSGRGGLAIRRDSTADHGSARS